MPDKVILFSAEIVFDRLKRYLGITYDTELNQELGFSQYNFVGIVRNRGALSAKTLAYIIDYCVRKNINLNKLFDHALLQQD